MRLTTIWLRTIVGLVLIPAAGCTLKATFESTTDTTSNFLSSTTPGAWVTEDGLLRAEHRVGAFMIVNRENLEQDIARGEGEYLASLGTLLGVTEGESSSFQAAAQGEFHTLLPLDQTARTQRVHAWVR
jgi:hypothetical protein